MLDFTFGRKVLFTGTSNLLRWQQVELEWAWRRRKGDRGGKEMFGWIDRDYNHCNDSITQKQVRHDTTHRQTIKFWKKKTQRIAMTLQEKSWLTWCPTLLHKISIHASQTKNKRVKRILMLLHVMSPFWRKNFYRNVIKGAPCMHMPSYVL